MHEPRNDLGPISAPLAQVIPLSAALRQRSERGPADEQALVDDPGAGHDALARDIELLRRRHGDRWLDLPADVGRRLAAAETLLVRGPSAIDSGGIAPADAAQRATRVARAAAPFVEIFVDDAEVLGEGLGVELVDLPLRRLGEVVEAVLDLRSVARPDPSWATPSASQAAQVVLDAHGPELRETAQLHDRLYDRFTEHVLAIPDHWFRAARRPWRLYSRIRLRRALVAVSRTGQARGSLTTLARMGVDVHAARARLDQMATLLSSHLGHHHQGPLSDVDAAIDSLAALRRLQEALGDRLDPERVARLLLADALTSDELVEPASRLHDELRSWSIELATICAADAWALASDELSRWIACAETAASDIEAAVEATADLDNPPSTLRGLVDDLLVREHVEELGARLLRESAPGSKDGSAS